MEQEMTALWANQTWTFVPLPTGQTPVGCKWVFVIKHAPDGTIDRLKARLVARGFTQQQGLDYEETFSPVAKLNTIRVLLSVGVHRQWPLHQLDIKMSSSTVTSKKRFSCSNHPGLRPRGSPEFVISRISSMVSNNPLEHGLTSSVRSSGKSASLGVQLTSHYSHVIRQRELRFKGHPSSQTAPQLHLSNQGSGTSSLLGIKVPRRPDGLVISQRKYCLDLLQDAGYSGCKTTTTLMDANHKLCAHSSDTNLHLQNPEYYRRLVGILIYLTVTRPNISFVVGVVSRFMHSPRTSHLQDVERILRYLKTSSGQGLVYKTSSSTPTLVAYFDADYVGSLDDRRSTSGFCTYFGEHFVTWQSKKQAVVARSSTEAEYRSMAFVVSELT
ncbi:hypothetical protein KSP39_PZI006527 [Platanthera zijinensis]|uniref:Reverse transcriptase Ty1/copia-type domain-containing protein n=1 Tax=Platanthera zijinensis TaxID=2320716 RepID=A0AAP0G9Q6_9ASPA